MINLICGDHESRIKMRITCVHAPNHFRDRLKLWDDLRQIGFSNGFPRVCLGDFNEVLYYWEKFGTRMAKNYRMQTFQNYLNDCLLMEIDCKWCAFTWSNNRIEANLVKEKLDRVFCSLDWRLSFPEAKAYALPVVGSDHSPLLLMSNAKPAKKIRDFHFEAFWTEDEECREIVKQAWQSQNLYEARLRDKLMAVKHALKEWSKKKFPNSQSRIKALKQELQSLTNNTVLSQGENRMKLLKE